MNRLFFGDNLEILRDKVDDQSVDLVYLDPPFNSNATYNVLFAEKSGKKSGAQISLTHQARRPSRKVKM